MQESPTEGLFMSWEEYEKARRALQRGHAAAVRRINAEFQGQIDDIWREERRRTEEVRKAWDAKRMELGDQRNNALRELHDKYDIITRENGETNA